MRSRDGRFAFATPPELAAIDVHLPTFPLPDLPGPDQPLAKPVVVKTVRTEHARGAACWQSWCVDLPPFHCTVGLFGQPASLALVVRYFPLGRTCCSPNPLCTSRVGRPLPHTQLELEEEKKEGGRQLLG
jgi:hypothetical protein